ncbi:phytoene/squalene synthase family protein [Rhizobium sp. KVB221]|uniref:Phytoene/squalene synthase family protein n=1 Tax=Rhizobium setariae TaxID=2801340 RepID=A0A936YTV9_9HYPH|nr:phytoene/squalene synthase family protein [Rhizobium setariae]MBL0374876.1 phytoene/squalene synthase family protein [Rhizobium setariae]
MSLSRADAYQACLDTLRSTDFDRYLACLLMPENKRGAVAALYTFNAEIARIRDVIREPLPGEIRLQWWRDVLEGTAEGDSLANPLAAGLLQVIAEYDLPRSPLLAMTDARIFDLYDDPMGDTAMFEGYAGETASTLIQLAALILDPANAARSAEAAGHAGVAQATAGCLMLMPIHIRRHQVYIPATILQATGLNAGAFIDGADHDRCKAAIDAFVGLGRDHLASARAAARGHVSPTLNLAFLGAALAEPVFDRAARAGASLRERMVQPSQLARQWRMWRAARRGVF